MPVSLEQKPVVATLSRYLPDLLPQLEVFLTKSGICAGTIARYRPTFKVVLAILDQLGDGIEAIFAAPFEKEFFRENEQRRRDQLHNIRRFFRQVRLPGIEAEQSAGLPLLDAGSLFLEYLLQRGYKRQTIANYRHTLNGFLTFCQERQIMTLDALSRRSIYDYQNHLYVKSKTRYSPAKKAHILYELKSFLRFLCKRGHTLTDYGLFLEIPRQEKRISRNIFSREEIRRLFAVIDTGYGWGFMDRTAFQLLYGSGLRLGELSSLELGDICLEEGTLFVRQGKGGKDRVVPLSESCKQYLSLYIQEVRQKLLALCGNPASKLLFAAGGNKPADTLMRRIRQVLCTCQKKAGFEKLRSPHAFRYSCATHMLENGASIRMIGELLGHSGLDTTSTYTKVTARNLMEAISHHPRAAEAAGKQAVFRGKKRRP